jgi:hypothetical protein
MNSREVISRAGSISALEASNFLYADRVIDCGGSGKTRLAGQLAALLDLPLTHLDSPLLRRRLARAAAAGLRRSTARISRPAPLAHRRRLCQHSDDSGRRSGHRDLPGPPCDYLLARHPSATLPLPRGRHANEGVFDWITVAFVRHIWRYRRTMRPKIQRQIGRARRSRPPDHPDQSTPEQTLSALPAPKKMVLHLVFVTVIWW